MGDPRDIHYGGYLRIRSLAERHGFTFDCGPDAIVFPPLAEAPPPRRIGLRARWGGTGRFIGLPFPVTPAARLGYPPEAFHNSLSFTLRPVAPSAP